MATNQYINIYYQDTNGGTADANGIVGTITGTPDTTNDHAISSEGSQTSPLSVTINSSDGTPQYRRVAIRCEANFKTADNSAVTIGFSDQNPGTSNGGYTDSSGNPHDTNECWRIFGGTDAQFSQFKTWIEEHKTDFFLDANKAKYSTLTFDPNEAADDLENGKVKLTAPIDSKSNKVFFIAVLAFPDESPIVDKDVVITTTATIAAEDTPSTP